MQLEVVTPTGKLLEAQADEVTAPGSSGEFGVLPGHVPLLSGLRPGVISWSGTAGSGRLAIGKGFAQVVGDRVVVLVSSGAKAEQVDAAVAERDLVAANKALDGLDDDPGARTEAEERRDWAQARLDLAAMSSSRAH